MITGLSLFTGGGLCDVGLSGIVSFVGGVELDPAIAAHASLSLGHEVTCASVIDIDYRRQWQGIDHIHASPPCTNASVANANAGETELDRALGTAVCWAIRHIRPRFFTLENVAGYAAFEAFQDILATLANEGYTVHWRVYDAADFGVPQHRRRIMLRARRDGKPLPEVIPTHGSPAKVNESLNQGNLFADPLLPWNGWYAAIEDLLPECPDTQLAPWQVKRLEAQYGEGWAESLLVRYAGQDSDPGGTPGSPSPTLTSDGAGKSRALIVNGVPASHKGEIDARGERRDSAPLTSSIDKHPMRALLCCAGNANGAGKVPLQSGRDAHSVTSGAGAYRALLVEGQSKGNRAPSLTEQGSPSPAQAGTGGGNLNRAILAGESILVVALTPRCLARFQSVPDSYPLPAKKSLATRIIGNGVPSFMARAIFGPMLSE